MVNTRHNGKPNPHLGGKHGKHGNWDAKLARRGRAGSRVSAQGSHDMPCVGL